jgi:hypothetical protein
MKKVIAFVGSAHKKNKLFQLMLFRFGRTTVKQAAGEKSLDYRYFAEKGWLESDHYYPTRLGALKKTAGYLLDSITATMRSML